MVEKKKSLIGKSVDIKATQLDCHDEAIALCNEVTLNVTTKVDALKESET